MTGEGQDVPKLVLWRRALAFVGIETSPMHRWNVRIRRRFFIIVLASLSVFFISLIGAASYSTSPSFCRSCHIMEPYYQAWAKSKHNDVACVECHYPPGEPKTILWKKFQALSQVAKYITRTYSSKPFAEVEDASCLRSGCHDTRLLRGKVISEKGILFDHKPHLEGVRYGRQLRCVSCHSQVVVGKHIEVTWDTCYLCHMKGHKSGRNIEPMGGCQGCHTLPSQDVKVGNITYNHKEFLGEHQVACQSCHQDVIQGEGDVSEDRCLTCHNQPEKIARFKDVAFIHDNHVTKHNTACFHCHKEIKHGVATAGTKSLTYDCSMCHSDMHDLQRNLYRGVVAKGVPPMPSPMYLANVDCIACHISKKHNGDSVTKSETYTGSEKGCTNCHGKEYTGVLGEANNLINDTRQKLSDKLAALKKSASSSELEDALYNLKFVESSHSVHNIYYAAQILRYTNDLLTAVAKKIGAEVEDTSGLPIISGSFCGTLCHSKVGVKVPPPEKVTFKGKIMPHKEHVEQGLVCTTCHIFGTHKDVRLKADTVCKKCHEEEDKK